MRNTARILVLGAALLVAGCTSVRPPAPDLFLQNVHRQRAVFQHLRVEFAQVKAIAERGGCAAPQCLDPELADLVAERLARVDDVAFDLRLDRRREDQDSCQARAAMRAFETCR